MQYNFDIKIPYFLIVDEDQKHNQINFDLLENKDIVGLLGNAKSGKDTIANIYVKKYGFNITSNIRIIFNLLWVFYFFYFFIF